MFGVQQNEKCDSTTVASPQVCFQWWQIWTHLWYQESDCRQICFIQQPPPRITTPPPPEVCVRGFHLGPKTLADPFLHHICRSAEAGVGSSLWHRVTLAGEHRPLKFLRLLGREAQAQTSPGNVFRKLLFSCFVLAWSVVGCTKGDIDAGCRGAMLHRCGFHMQSANYILMWGNWKNSHVSVCQKGFLNKQ